MNAEIREVTDIPVFPKFFPIPDYWNSIVDAALKEKRVTPYVRKEIVQTLCTSMKVYAYDQKPTLAQCESVAAELIKKYPFLKDPIGSPTVSIYMYY